MSPAEGLTMVYVCFDVTTNSHETTWPKSVSFYAMQCAHSF